MFQMKKVLFVLFLLLVVAVFPTFAQDNSMMDAGMSSLGRTQFVKGEVAADDSTIKLPLYQGSLADGKTVLYILTDASDEAAAAKFGINYSPALSGAAGNTRTATADSKGLWVFDKGTVDFSPELAITPGPASAPFPPAAVTPGSVGDADYTPLVTVDNVIYNAPIVAFNVDASAINFCDGNVDHKLVHDKATAICPTDKTITVSLTSGFGFGRVIIYLSTDANVDVAAALEASTLTPRLNDLAGKATAPLFLAVNGPMGKDNPTRQGVDSALSGEGGPRNLLGQIPGLSDKYSPIWDVSLYAWTDAAIKAGYRTQLIDTAYQLPTFAKGGWITAPDGTALKSSGPLVNCPVILREE
jgi:hypothetical protein